MAIHVNDFLVPPGGPVDLAKWPTRIPPPFADKDAYRSLLAGHVERLAACQELLYAANTHAVLVIFQAMDTAGKDGAIKHVMSGVNPQGCVVTSFSHPTPTELRHDFLWRTTQHLPERGRIGIFNRSYYEEVLIARVHPEILKNEGVPEDGGGDTVWARRFRSILDLERHLHGNGTRIVKFFLHISKEEQRQRLLARIDDASKNWKFSPDDLRERGYWDAYMRAYEACLGATSTEATPWHVVPADDKHTARLVVSHVLLDAIEGLKLRVPKPDAEQRRALQAARKALEAEAT